jgi:hypothetical protein
MKQLLIVFILNLFIQCASVNLIKVPIGPGDNDQIPKLAELQEEGFKIENKYALVRTVASTPELKAYDDAIHASSLEMVDSLGGVEVIEPRDANKILEERKLVYKTKLNDMGMNQRLGTEAGVLELINSEEGFLKVAKYLADYAIFSQLTNVQSNVVYNPPKTYTDKKTGETKTTDPSWTMTVTAGVGFRVINSDGNEVYANNLKNSYSKTLSEEPPASMAHVFLPKAIEYCFEDVKPDLQAIFSLKTRIIALKGSKKYAMINGGIQNKIRKKRVFEIIDADKAVATIKIFQANQSDAWGEVSGEIDKVKIGSQVALKPQKRTILDKIWRFIESNFGL